MSLQAVDDRYLHMISFLSRPRMGHLEASITTL